MDNKICKRCKELLPISDFTKSKNNKGGSTTKCNKCIYNSYYKDKDDKLKYRSKLYQLKHLYGLSKETYEILVDDCNNSCEICKKPAEELKTGLCIDHCHSSSKIRGLLCQDCNRGLGMFHDDPILLEKAINYLKVK